MVLVDAHVHIYDCFDLPKFFDAALSNFRDKFGPQGEADEFTGVLLLTEGSHERWFQRLSALCDEETGLGNWVLSRTDEENSLWARRNSAEALLVVAGRQIVTAEDLEVLALITNHHFEDGHSLDCSLDQVTKSGAIPVIAWGFGKWIGRRGKIVETQVRNADEGDFFLGENGGCARCIPRPRHFRTAKEKGIRTLPGSDPLPFSREASCPGSYGIALRGRMSLSHPAEDLRALLQSSSVSSSMPFGEPRSFLVFAKNQLAMQAMKRGLLFAGKNRAARNADVQHLP
jgi:hypothetical protein